MRRTADLIIVLLAAVPAAAIALLVAGAVATMLGRPVLFRQARAGRDGHPFPLVKFRSMAALRDQHGQLLPDELRLTRFGRLLRRTRLDELPELWNIIKGDMSVVGPRPLLPVTIAQMEERGRLRGRVRPGLTGWAQVHGNSLLSDADKLALDLWYVERASLRLDLQIMVRTVIMLLFGERIAVRKVREAYASIDRRCG